MCVCVCVCDVPNKEVCTDQHTGGTGSELPHNKIPILLLHVAVLLGKEREGGREC